MVRPSDDYMMTTEELLAETQEVLALPLLRRPHRSFVEANGCLSFARYKWDGSWRLAKVRSVDPNETVTLVWEDGFLQIGTKPTDARRAGHRAVRALEALSALESSSSDAEDEPIQEEENLEPTIWELTKRGKVDAVVRLVDQGLASANDLEEIDGKAGRSVLYHACFSGHPELVAALLARGAVDWDGTCELAVTGSERANDDLDLTFDPDENTYSDFVDYAEPSRRVVGQSSYDRIRTMLNRARETAPPVIFRSSANSECCVCAARKADAVSICGHIACCRRCLTRLRDRREGCPICRCRIKRILDAPMDAVNGEPVE